MASAGRNSRIALGRTLFPLLALCAGHVFAAGDGLLGTYYDQNGQAGQYFTGGTVARVDSTVNFNWGGGSPASGIGTNSFSVRWTGGAGAGYAINAQCTATPATEGPDSYTVFTLLVSASRGAFNSSDFVSRTVRATVSNAP